MIARVSDLTSYLYCPRLCYYRNRFGEKAVNEMHAARDIYISRRMRMDDSFALQKFVSYYGEKNSEVFSNALKKFVYNPILDELNAIDWEVLLKSERFRLKGLLDELVKANSKIPLVLSLKAPENDVWFRDRIKLAAFCMLLNTSEGYVYHCYDGELRRIEIGRRDKRNVLKLIERVLKIKDGFIPEKTDDKKCEKCLYHERCCEKQSTFASRFFRI